MQHILQHIYSTDSSYFHERPVLAPTNEIVDKVNEHVLSLIAGGKKCI